MASTSNHTHINTPVSNYRRRSAESWEVALYLLHLIPLAGLSKVFEVLGCPQRAHHWAGDANAFGNYANFGNMRASLQ